MCFQLDRNHLASNENMYVAVAPDNDDAVDKYRKGYILTSDLIEIQHFLILIMKLFQRFSLSIHQVSRFSLLFSAVGRSALVLVMLVFLVGPYHTIKRVGSCGLTLLATGCMTVIGDC